ncbi:hypothetical protein AFCDBAGC_4891 [Methylobacterium cerastii]|uniref:Uncharacterized protein n=1 Tax=Methylobacterium cerastii TaxID=932741 RepID=A0ABQ4QPK8_9HYPH|nr:hypothetical protein AFCDBAGC_4891 [Methylobacterium cerastii]
MIPLPRRQAPHASPDFVELGTRWTVGGVRVVVASQPAHRLTGPYKVLLKAEGVPPCCVVSLTPQPGTTMAVLMDAIDGYSEAAQRALAYASEHLASLAPDPPRGAA